MSEEIIGAVGRRKEAVARVYMRPGSGETVVNGKDLVSYLGRQTLVMQVRQPEQVRRSFTGLHVFERDVIYRFIICKGVADVTKHLHARRLDVDLVCRDSQGFHEPVSICIGSGAGGKSGHGVAENI